MNNRNMWTIWYVESTSYVLTDMECIANSTLPLVYCKQHTATRVLQTAHCHSCIQFANVAPTCSFCTSQCNIAVNVDCRPLLYGAWPLPALFLMNYSFTYFVVNVLNGGWGPLLHYTTYSGICLVFTSGISAHTVVAVLVRLWVVQRISSDGMS